MAINVFDNESIEESIEEINRIKNASPTVLMVGSTGSAKSTFTNSTFCDELQPLLMIREGDSKATARSIKVIVTNSERILRNELYVCGKLKNSIRDVDIDDNNKLLFEILTNLIGSKKDREKIDEELDKEIQSIKTVKNNDSLAYKIKDMSEENEKKLKDCFKDFLTPDTYILYNEAVEKRERNGKKETIEDLFLDIICSNPDYSKRLTNFWNVCVGICNEDCDLLHEKLLDSGASINEDGSFIAVLDANAKDEKINYLLLSSEYGSKEYLINDITIIGRANDEIFDENTTDFVVFEQADRKVKLICFLDRQGNFHEEGSTGNKERERLEDDIKKTGCTNLIWIISPQKDKLYKEDTQLLDDFLGRHKGDINLFLVFGKYDIYLNNTDTKTVTNRFSIQTNNTDKDEIIRNARENRNRYVSERKESIKLNSFKNKPQIVGECCTAFFPNDETVKEIIREEKYDYPSAGKYVVDKLAEIERRNGSRIKVTGRLVEEIVFSDKLNTSQDVSALYRNLIENKEKKLYSSTVRAVIRHWTEFGDKHKSQVNEANPHGYQNIETSCVVEMRNYGMKFLKDIVFNGDAAQCIVDDSVNISELQSEFVDYISFYQRFGREFAIKVGEEVFNNGYRNNSAEWSYQYKKLSMMFNYAECNYFTARSVYLNDKIRTCLEGALKKCVEDFISSRCIVVYD